MQSRSVFPFLLLLLFVRPAFAREPETLPSLSGETPSSLDAPSNFDQMWRGFDPRAEPLETETLREWEQDGVILRVVRFRVGVFKGTTARLAAVYGFPNGGTKFPGLVQIHGGGQYADHKACLMNAQRGYATISIAWAGRISAPDYRVGPAEVKLFWEDNTDDPNYKITTDWGAVDGYHAPARHPGNQFPSAKAAEWTLDEFESPRNSGWFLCALAARRALTFLERQPEVDADRLGVYGHSMGGKLTVLTAPDSRVKAAAPSCGGISDRYNASELFRATLGDDVSLNRITCPIIFLSPSNDFHGRIGDLPKAIDEIKSRQWRVTCSAHHNHQDTAPFEVATLLWFDQHLKKQFVMPDTPESELTLNTEDGIPRFTVRPDHSMPITSVNIFYTQQGEPNETPAQRENTVHRFWHHAQASENDGMWSGKLPVWSTKKPLWVYANVTYRLDKPVDGAGYYYRIYSADSFNLSSLLKTFDPETLQSAKVKATLKPTVEIEDFQGDWEKEWFTYKPEQWARSTHKLYDARYQAPPGASLTLEVKSEMKNRLVILMDQYAAEIPLAGGEQWQSIRLKPSNFRSLSGAKLNHWNEVRRLTLSAAERLKPGRGETGESRIVGGNWKGKPPQLRNLRWSPESH